MKKLSLGVSILVSLSLNFLTTLSVFAGCSLNEESPSLQVIKKYVANTCKEATRALDLFEDSEISDEDVAKGWAYEYLPADKLLTAPFMRKAESIKLYRHILSEEPAGMHSYHGYDHFSAGRYDIYTLIAEAFNNAPVETRSRFRYDAEYRPYASATEFLQNVRFYNDHEPQFDRYGISAVPHLFSGTVDLGENCLSGLHNICGDLDLNKFEFLMRGMGFKNEKRYSDLVEMHLRGGFITRFTFNTEKALDTATYPAPNATETGLYGKPWISQRTLIHSSEFLKTLNKLEHFKDNDENSFVFNMQYRNIFTPSVYNDSNLVKTKIFSQYEFPTLGEYYQTLRGYIKEDITSWSVDQREKAELWLK